VTSRLTSEGRSCNAEGPAAIGELQGPAAAARGRDPQAERPLRGPGVPEARDRKVEPAEPRTGRDRGAHHGAPSPLRAASPRNLTTATGRRYPGRRDQLSGAHRPPDRRKQRGAQKNAASEPSRSAGRAVDQLLSIAVLAASPALLPGLRHVVQHPPAEPTGPGIDAVAENRSHELRVDAITSIV
jgi:hypothetical protein